MNETTETKIPVNIETGYIHASGNQIREATQRIEKTALHIESLFNLIKASSFNAVAQSSEAYQLNKILEDVQNVSELGSSLALSIFESILPISQVENDLDESNRIINNIPADAVATRPQTDALAVQMSELLNNPDLPHSIYNALMSALNDVYNSQKDAALENYETSPEYLKVMFAGAKSTEVKNG